MAEDSDEGYDDGDGVVVVVEDQSVATTPSISFPSTPQRSPLRFDDEDLRDEPWQQSDEINNGPSSAQEPSADQRQPGSSTSSVQQPSTDQQQPGPSTASTSSQQQPLDPFSVSAAVIENLTVEVDRLRAQLEQFRCPCCLDIFNEVGSFTPRVLDCGHIVCIRCLMSLGRECPNCRKEIIQEGFRKIFF